MKKIVKLFFILIMFVLCTTTLSACGKCEHTYGNWTVVKAATCTEDGKKEHKCTECGHKETEKINALGHDYVGGICTDCGKKQ